MGQLNPLWWVGIGAILIWLDYVAGLDAQFPALYVIPVTLAAWYSGRWSAVGLAVAVPVTHVGFLMALWKPAGSLIAVVGPTMLRGAIILVMALWFARLAEHERKVHRYVKRLEGLLPICSFCKSIRNKAGEWEPIEAFIADRSDAEFSHSFCKNCGKLHYPDFDYDYDGEVAAGANRRDAAG